MQRFLSLALVLIGLIATHRTGSADPPGIIGKRGTRADRGNVESRAYMTGPTSPIVRLYNDDTEISFWNQPHAMTFSLAKNDVWDRRYFGDTKKIITLEDVRRVCFEGKIGRSSDLGLPDSPQALYAAYDFPCPKPVGQVIVRIDELRGHDEYVVGTGHKGLMVAKAKKGNAKAALWGLLHKTKNLLVMRGEYAGLSQPVRVQFYRHKDTTPLDTSISDIVHRGGKTNYDYSRDRPHNGPMAAPEMGTDGRFFWVRQRFHAEKTFPKGFECVMMGVIDGPSYKVKTDAKAVGAGEDAVVHPITPEVYKSMAGWLKETRRSAERVNDAQYGGLTTATLDGGSGSFVLYVAVATTRDAADPMAAARKMLLDAQKSGPDALFDDSAKVTDKQAEAWRNSRVMHYNATSCKYADATTWHGDYHFNEGYFLPTVVRGAAASLEPRLLMFEGMLPALKRNAREVYGCQGICFPLVHYPIKHDRVVYGNVTWEFGIENTALMLQPFWHIFQYTQDKEFLRKRAYPMMREGALFHADYAKKGDDGCYHVVPTVSQEHWGFTPKFRLNRESVGALSFTKYHLKACIQASEILGVDAEHRARWREIVEHLAPYPTLKTDEGLVFCDMRDAPRLLNYNITANLVMVLWAEDISLDSPPELLEMARRSYRAIPDKEHSMRKGYLHRIRLHLGMLEKPYLGPQGRVLSWPGRIHLYVGVPKGATVTDQFSGLLAVGAFEVSAAHVGKEVRRVRIKSRVGGTCKVKNPWQPADVLVMERASREIVKHAMDGDTIVFDTQPGRAYSLLSPAERQLARMRFVAEPKTIGRWIFSEVKEGVVPDASGQGHPAKLIGKAAVVPIDGGHALKLGQPESYARIERAKAFDFGAHESFSVEARIKLGADAEAVNVPLVCSMAIKQYCFEISRGRVKLYLSSPLGDNISYVVGKTLVTDGKWHNVRAVRDAADETLKVYVDGRLDGQIDDATSGDFASKAPITIGAYLWGSHTRFGRGLITDVQIKSLGKLVERAAPPK